MIRTNPLLTTNFKVVVSSDYSLYLESFNTNTELSNVNYKHYPIYKNDLLENKLPLFYNKLPIELAFDVRYDNDNNIIQSSYDYQFDTTYHAGAGYIEDQWHKEEFEYFAPLYIRKNFIPKAFIILRVDHPIGYTLNNNNLKYDFYSSNKENFNEILNEWKCVNLFDLTYTSDLGKWLYKNYLNNDRFPKMAFEYNPEKSEFSNWYGIDYNSGIYTYKPLFIDDRNGIETPHFRFEKYITEGYKRSELIFPYILNLKFLFDDTPATPNSLRKYSMNRYYGFYADDIEFVSNITSYVVPNMRDDTYMLNNIILLSGSTDEIDECNLDNISSITSISPFIEDWNDNKDNYVFIDNTNDLNRTKTISGLYLIKRIQLDGVWMYKVISDEIMDDYWNNITYQNFIKQYGHSNIKNVSIKYDKFNILSGMTIDFSIDKYIDCNLTTGYTYADLYLIKIDEKYHVIKYSSGITYSTTTNNKNSLITNSESGDSNFYQYYIQSDYAINLNSNYIEYWINGKNSQYYKKYNVEDPGVRQPLTFPIYKIKFTDIKDFDFDRVDTKYSDFDYEKTEYVDTFEEKLYANDYNNNSIPFGKKLEKLGTTSEYKISNVSSEYIAGDELYEIYNKGKQYSISNDTGGENNLYDLSDIWRKNQSIVKWGFMGSISHSDYPYKLNNNYEIGGDYNKTIDPFATIPDTKSKNLDYFYRIGNFYTSSGYTYYKNQSTNIQYDFVSTVIGNGFDMMAYFGTDLNMNFDYFTFFFKNKMYYQDNSILLTKKYDKYSIFNCGDQYSSSVTLFKGLKIKIREIKNIYQDDNKITKIAYGNKTYNDYKCSIILNENYIDNNSGLINYEKYIDTRTNGINIILNEKYKNLLIIINACLSGNTLNNLDVYNEKDGLYYGKNKNDDIIADYDPKIFTSYNFISAINDYVNDYNLIVKYYTIKELDGIMYSGSTIANNFKNSTMDQIPDWEYKFQSFMINIENPINIDINNKCYSTTPYYVSDVNNDYVSTIINFEESKLQKTNIFRFSGPYEPIFKDINLFKNHYFCYNCDIVQYPITATTQSSASLAEQTSTTKIVWEKLNNICSVVSENYVQCNVNPNTVGITNNLLIYGFNFNIPNEATITGITVIIQRKSDSEPTKSSYVKDHQIKLTKNITSGIFSHTNGADFSSPYKYANWRKNLQYIVYPPNDQYNMWGWPAGSLTGSDVNSQYFGVMINTSVYNDNKESIILPQIKCVQVALIYTYNKTEYENLKTIYFDDNYKFDTSLEDFGQIGELVFSKVNEQVDILKESNNKYNIYPIIDEFGYKSSKRYIFKSSWDKEFFIKSLPNIVTPEAIFIKPPIVGIPTVLTVSIGNITDTGSTCDGEVTSSGYTTAYRGICWSTSTNPTYNDTHTSNGTGLGTFTGQITNLLSESLYYARAYAINSIGVSYGDILNFTTSQGLYEVTTSGITQYTVYATGGGTITSGDGYITVQRGVCWSTLENPEYIENVSNYTIDGSGTGDFISSIMPLEPETTYYVRSYGIDQNGKITYGNEEFFTTDGGVYNLTTGSVDERHDITDYSAICKGSVLASTGYTNSQRGVCWDSKTTDPIYEKYGSNYTIDEYGDGVYDSVITGLTPGRRYNYRTYCDNPSGTYYGVSKNFITEDGYYNVSIVDYVKTSYSEVMLTITINSSPGYNTVQRGVCWSTSPSPTIDNDMTNDGTGSGTFSTKMIQLSGNTTYYFRGYGINQSDVVLYSSEESITTGTPD